MSPRDRLVEPSVIHVANLRLWAHVGVLEHERRDGQWFRVDLRLWVDVAPAAQTDDLAASLDYSKAIQALQVLSRETRCLTIERFSEAMLDCLEALYGPYPIWLKLTKCAAPVSGFSGEVAIERRRHGAPQLLP